MEGESGRREWRGRVEGESGGGEGGRIKINNNYEGDYDRRDNSVSREKKQ